MAKCKLCKVNIPDGAEYCKDCLDKGLAKSNESYLDSLLNSVKNTEPNTEMIYKKKKNTTKGFEVDTPKPESTSSKVENTYDFDIPDMEDFDQLAFEKDLSDFQGDVLISDEDLFGEDLSDLFPEEKVTKKRMTESIVQEDNESNSENDTDVQADSELTSTVEKEEEQVHSEWENDVTNMLASTEMDDEITAAVEQEPIEEINPSIGQEPIEEINTVVEQEPNGSVDSNINEDEIQSYNTEQDFEADLNELLNGFNTYQDTEMDSDHAEGGQDSFMTKQNTASSNSSDFGIPMEPVKEESNNNQQEEEDDFLSLLNQISSDDPVSEDVKAIGDLMSGIAEPHRGSSTPSDVGDVFSDALKAVSNLNDPNINEDAILSQIGNEKVKKEKKKKSKKKGSDDQIAEGVEEKSKKSLWKRLFGNIKDEKAASNKSDQHNDLMDEALATKESAKKEKPKKGNKSKGSKGEDKKQDRANQDKDDSEEEATNKKSKKKEKKPKKQKVKDAIQVIDEIEEDEGRINRLGASIVFIFFGLLALLLYVGSNTVNYTIAIQHASNYFDKQKYTQAYYEVYGVDIKDEDMELYEKIKTVMFVNKQLNSYNNYYALKEYPQALDSLLKGLKRYDKYIEFATILGIKTDMDYVREQILAELNKVFNISEKDAMKMIQIEDMKEYSLKVYDIVLENKDNLQQ